MILTIQWKNRSSFALGNGSRWMQVEYYYTTSPSGLEEVIGYWNFNQGDGDIVSDLSGNENNGSLNGTVWVQEEESISGKIIT